MQEIKIIELFSGIGSQTKSDFAHTLLERDYKGLTNYGSNTIVVAERR